MRGQIKMAGDFGTLLRFLPADLRCRTRFGAVAGLFAS